MSVEAEPAAPTIYDVARAAGVSIASVSRVLNGRRNPSPEIRDRVRRAVTELGYAPDSAARALSVRLKEVVGVVMRRPLSAGAPIPTPVLPAGPAGAWDTGGLLGYDAFADETDSLQFHDMLNRGVERAAQRRGFDLLLRSVDIADHDAGRRVVAIARKSDGLILHDGVLEPGQIDQISRQIPIVTLAGIPSRTTANVGSDNVAGMRALARHLLYDHGYTTLGFLSGDSDSPDSQARLQTLAAAAGAVLHSGPQWRGNYYAAGAAVVTERLLASGAPLPRVIVCANDQTALGVMQALRRSGVEVPGTVAVTGFDDIPMARHVHPLLTTVRQPIGDLGETAFEVLYSMVGRVAPAERNISLPTRLMCRESCGCLADSGRLAGVTDLSAVRQLRS